VEKIRASLAKKLISCGVTGDAVDKMAERIERDVKEPVFGITPMDVANIRIKHEPGKDVFVYIGRRDWQFGEDGHMVGAGYGFGCC